MTLSLIYDFEIWKSSKFWWYRQDIYNILFYTLSLMGLGFGTFSIYFFGSLADTPFIIFLSPFYKPSCPTDRRVKRTKKNIFTSGSWQVSWFGFSFFLKTYTKNKDLFLPLKACTRKAIGFYFCLKMPFIRGCKFKFPVCVACRCFRSNLSRFWL